jgi:hypothetical protein
MNDKIIAAATAKASARCDVVLAACARLSATPDQRERAKRGLLAEFDANDSMGRVRAPIERTVLDLYRNEDDDIVGLTTRDDLIDAIGVYCAAGKAEVMRRLA